MSETRRSESCDSEKKYELVPPEGGWGYAVCVGLSVIFVSIILWQLNVGAILRKIKGKC